MNLSDKKNLDHLIDVISGLAVELKYLKRSLKFRLKGNDIEGTIAKCKDNVNGFAKRAGTFEAYVTMSNDELKNAIINIEKMQERINTLL